MSAGRRGGACACGLLLGLLLIAVAPLAALDPNRRLTQYRVETWGVEEGLPSLSVAVVTQTPDGYLWIGTTEGLASFDGVRFRTYDRWNTPAFRLNEIRSLFVDSRGALWIGFAGSGVVVRERDEFVAVEPSDLTAVNFAEDADGVLLGTDRGLFHRRHDAPLRFAPVSAAATLSGRPDLPRHPRPARAHLAQRAEARCLLAGRRGAARSTVLRLSVRPRRRVFDLAAR